MNSEYIHRHEPDKMNKSYLIQRLEKPRSFGRMGLKTNPFSFGGGLRNGGLTDEARRVLNQVFDFAYMGAAEFEWGAVPDALRRIFEEREKFELYTIVLKWKDVAQERFTFKDDLTDRTTNGEVELYLFCHKDEKEEVERRVRDFAKDVPSDQKEPVYLGSYLRRRKKDVGGWLELNNGYFFFMDKQMAEGTREIFKGDKSDAA